MNLEYKLLLSQKGPMRYDYPWILVCQDVAMANHGTLWRRAYLESRGDLQSTY